MHELTFFFLPLILVSHFPENIFTQQPSYYGDLDETIPSIIQVSHVTP